MVKNIFLSILLLTLLGNSQAQNRIWVFGGNTFSQLGDPSIATDSLLKTPKVVDNGTATLKTIFLSSETGTNITIKSDGSLWGWGYGTQGQIGDSLDIDQPLPVFINAGTGIHGKWVFADMGGTHGLAIREDGSLWAWGSGTYGKLGTGNTRDTLKPTMVDAGTGVHGKWKMVDAGLSHSLGLREDGSLWAWGYNTYGQLGIGSNVPDRLLVPTLVDEGTGWGGKFVQISSTAHHNIAIKANGSVWGWGWNAYGNVGNGNQVNVAIPTVIDSGNGASGKWKYASAGYYHNVALRADSTIWGWGRNNHGQLANANTAVNVLLPVMMDAGTSGNFGKWILIEAGQNHTLGIRANKSFWSWGYNSSGQLGDGTVVEKTAPVQIPSLNNLVNPVVRGGISHTIILELQQTVVPVKLTSFLVTKQNKTAVLNWQTSNETNNKGFVIERSNNGTNWTKIDFVMAKGQPANYTYADNSPLKGINYYRLVQEDLDGQTSFSAIRNVNFDDANTGLSIYPNPVEQVLNIASSKAIRNISLINAVGQTVSFINANGNTQQIVNAGQLTSGIYILQIIYTDGKHENTRLIKR